MLAPSGNVSITAKKVDIVEAREASANQTVSKFEQSGVTLSVGNPAIAAAQTLQKMATAAENTKSTRMKTLAAASAALSANSALPAAQKLLSGFDWGEPTRFFASASSRNPPLELRFECRC